MLDNIEIIRQVLASASRAKLPRAGEAMDALGEINAMALELKELNNEIKDSGAQTFEQYSQGGGNFHD